MGRSVALPTITDDSALGGTVIEKSVRFHDADGAHFRRDASSTGNRRTFTFSCWVKRMDLGAYHSMFGAQESGTNNVDYFLWWNDDTLAFTNYNSSNYDVRTNAKYRDSNSWYHLVLAVDSTQGTASNRVKIYVNGSQVTSFADSSYPSQNYEFEVDRNVRHRVGFNGYNYMDGYMANIHHVDGQQLDASAFGYTDDQTGIWRPKAYSPHPSPNNGTTWSNHLTVSSGSINNAANAFNADVLSFNVSSVDEAIITFTPPGGITYQNSVRIWLRTSGHKARLNGGTYVFNTGAPTIGQWMYLANGTSGTISTIDVQYTGGSLSAINAIEVDGHMLINGLNDINGYGTNGFELKFEDDSNATATTLGRDSSGNGNNFTPANLSVTAGTADDVFADSPTKSNKIAHFNRNLNFSADTEMREGGYRFVNGSAAQRQTRSNFSVNSGKWYAEFTIYFTARSGSYPYIGVGPNNNFHQSWAGERNVAWNSAGVIYRSGSTFSSGNPTYANSDTISVAMNLDLATPQVWWAKNGSYIVSGNPATNANGVNIPTSYTGYYDFVVSLFTQAGGIWDANFGQRAFAYTPPSGYEPLQKEKIVLNTPALTRAKKHFDVVTWQSDTRSSDRTIPLEFRPAFVWSKTYVGNAYHNALFNTNTGPNAVENSDEAFVENHTNGGKLREFDSKGFTWRYGAGSNNQWWNESNYKYVAWCWKGGEPDVPISGSTYFDGSSDYAKVAASGGSDDLAMGTGDFTVECWVKKDRQEHRGIWQISGTVGGLQSSNYKETLALGYQSGVWQTYGGTSGPSHESSSYPIEADRWYHTLLARSSGTTKFFVDGQQVISYADNRNYGDTTRYMAYGGYYNTSYLHRGSISNLNVIKGTALYTSNFTPPTEPLTAHANTKLLCCQSNTSATEKSVGPTITLVDNTRAENCNPFEAFSVDGVGYPTAALAGLTGGDSSISRATVNTKSGFSLITRKGTGSNATFPHGLGVTPNIVFYKNRETGGNWGFTGNIGELVYGTNKMTIQAATALTGDTNETLAGTNATVIQVGNSGAANASGNTHNYYCFAEKPGFSKFGTYYGDGSDDGAFVWCGFRPALIVVKNTDAGHNWRVHDRLRHGGNGVSAHHLEWSTAATQYSNYDLDFLGNGFKIRTNSTYVNNGSNTFFFMAFAEQIGTTPFETEANAE